MGLAFLAFVLLAGRVAWAHDFGDDIGDNAATAKSIVIGSNYTGQIEIDVDQDWFKFQATNSLKEYVVTVTTGTLWNSTVAFLALDGMTGLMQTDSVRAVTSRVSWLHIGPAATYYVQVGGFTQFTTGTYTIVVNQQDFVDNNHNGLPDAWELQYFHSTNALNGGATNDWDGDGVNNLDEFRTGMNPTNTSSYLRITDISAGGPGNIIQWDSAPYRWYGVESSTNLTGGNWETLGAVTNLNRSGLREFDDSVNSSPARFYRVRCLY